jgi:predicted amidophosphoribosyltransferase
MACAILRNEIGKAIGMICGVPRKHLCVFCRAEYSSKLCDFPVAKGKSCDAKICDACATSISADVDYCPRHRDQKPAAQQLSLLGDSL